MRLLRRDLIGVVIQTSVLMAAFMFFYYSVSFWYPTYLRESSLKPFWYLIALNLGGISGSIIWGRASEGRLGRRGAATLACFIGILMIPLYLMTETPALRLIGALLMGLTGPGMFGVIPGYLTERFPTAVRGIGPGVAYHAGAGIGSITPAVIGSLHDRGLALNSAMAICMAAAGGLAILVMQLGPETRGRQFTAEDS